MVTTVPPVVGPLVGEAPEMLRLVVLVVLLELLVVLLEVVVVV